ncbi:hypothetical protein NDU88_000343 [Pleurodeles waltl]|uniref:Uncharacterized protein n=1 Tax=Pleurodeles waltl TaxID=8319 RepID=A0AAV7V8R1_PLEWA|nr:hypothetical protein NDU88_000343 [Pleurodeles waltl]
MTEWLPFEEEEMGHGFEDALGLQLGAGLSESSHSISTLRKRKRARKSGSSPGKESSHSPSNPFQFNPEDIIHPRSADWAPAQAVADYLHDKLRKGFDKEVRNRLRAECPRPEIPDKVAETPDIDPSMLTFLKKFAKDPKKGIDRAWHSCQDKLLDLAGPLAKILEMALRAKESGEPIDPHTLAEWTQRAICLLGNANCAISSERRKSLLMRIDPTLTELATADAGSLADGRLFGNKFIKDVAKIRAKSGVRRSATGSSLALSAGGMLSSVSC